MGRGFGITAAVDHEVAVTVAREAERLGYSSFWSNDTQGHDGLETLAAAAAVTTTIKLGVGVIGLDRRTGDSIADDIARLRLTPERCMFGIGSGGDPTVAIVRQGISDLHRRGVRPVVVGALGPKMSRLTGQDAEGVLFNWLTPEFAAKAGRWVVDAAAEAGRPRPLVMAYVRTALLPQGDGQMDRQAAMYTNIPSYGAHFKRMGVSARGTSVTGADAATLQAGIAAHEQALDETIVRAITGDDSAESILELVRACAPQR
jgi:alkanesulfonate monooxygenase SsuD/methylene tetrahydromethanopterin reductase-like flavin-dependent oxidoreductase (luciferase family)